MIAAAAAARLRLLAASRRKCESMATAPDRHASCARWIVGTTKPRMMGSAQAAIAPTAGQSCELGRIALVAQVRGDVEAGAAARTALDQDQEAGDGDQDERDLRGALAIAEPVPGPIDRRRQRLHAVILDGAEIGERLEQRQHHAGGDGGPRQRQARRRRRCATGRGPGCGWPRSGLRLAQESGARGEIDVRIEHQREQQRDAAGRAEIGEPVVAAAPAGGLAQARPARDRRRSEGRHRRSR